MDNFDVHEWNKKRYLSKIEESDDPKIGSELEGDPDERVEEGMGPRQATMKLDQLTFNVVKSMFGEIPMFGIAFPNADDSYRSVFDGDDLEDWKARIRDRFGNVNIRIDVEAASKWDRVQILDDKFRGDKEDYIKGKAATLDRWRKSSNYGFDENLNEASYMYKGYEDKHFDICPTAEVLRDELLAGKFKDNTWATGTDFEKEVGEWRYQHDVLFKTEKQVLQDKEGDESDIEKAKVAIDRIVNLSRDLGIPADRLDYLKAHLKKITDIVEYSSLTEEDRFAGSDPRGGSTIKGTGFDWKRKEKKSLPLKLQWQGDFPSQQEVDDAFSSWQRETHYLASKPVEKWDEYDLSNFNAISRKGGKYDFNPLEETVKFIKENNPEFTTEEIATELKEIKMLGSQLDEEKSKLCKRGRDYIAARKRAGEKSSAYLSGRGVKVCKGQIKGTKGKKRKDYKG